MENIDSEDEGIRACVQLTDFDRRPPFYGKGEFAYDTATDVYRCPGGALLRPVKHAGAQHARIYQAPAAA